MSGRSALRGLCVSLFTILLSHVVPAEAQLYKYPKGSYGMQSMNDPVQTNLANDKGVVGILMSARWNELETKQGVYVWTKLDSAINAANKAGLKVALSLISSPSLAPSYIASHQGVVRFQWLDTNPYHDTACTNQAVPAFWDSFYLERKKALIRAAGARYSSNPAVVAVTVPFANMATDDWNVPHEKGYNSVCKVTIDDAKQWLSIGYTSEKMLSTGLQVLDTTAAAFPKQWLKLPIGHTSATLENGSKNHGRTSTYLAEQILIQGYARYSRRLIAQVNSLTPERPTFAQAVSDKTIVPNSFPYLYRVLASYPNVGLQMVGAAANGSKDGCRQNGGVSPCPAPETLWSSVNVGLTYKPNYLEYWKADANDQSLGSVLQNATLDMGGALR